MRLGSLAAKNVLRNKFRTTLTVCGVAVAILAFILLRTVLTAWTAAADYAAKDRIGTRHKVTFIMGLPKRYVDDLRMAAPELGIQSVTWANWFGGKDPSREKEFFATMAVDPASFLKVYDEVMVPEEQAQDWLENRRGAIVGDVLARKMGWEVGDKVTLVSAIYPEPFDFEIEGIYTATRRSVDRSSFYFHWDYLNESLPESWRDEIGWIVSRVDDPAHAADIAKKIDALFADRDVQTLSMSERAMTLSFLGMISAVLSAIDLVSVVILAIMVLILGNTIAMGVRERTHEYGVLRAIGFLPRHIALFVVGESVTTGLLGGALGILLSYPVVERGLGRYLEENVGSYFPYFRIAESTVLWALCLALALGAVAAAIPALRAARLNVTDSLRRVG